MAQRTKANYKATVTAQFPTNGTGAVGADRVRSYLGDDVADSALFIEDNFVDEDDMASNSATKAPSQQSVKAYVDNNINGGSIDLFMRYRDDFLSAATFLSHVTNGGAGSASGVGGTHGVDNTEKATGVAQLQTGTTTTGVAGLVSNPSNMLTFGFGFQYDLIFRAALSAASDGTDTYTARIGFIDSQSGAPTDGAYFRYTDGINSGKWEAVTISNGAETAEDTGIAGAADTSYHLFKIVVNAAGTQVDFYIDGVLTNDITTNVINSSARLTGCGALMVKSAGTTSRIMYLDYADLVITRTTAR